jgi:DNA-binding HxlR family transcriptional regulator
MEKLIIEEKLVIEQALAGNPPGKFGQTYSHTQCLSRLRDVGDAIYVIGGKWKLRIIIALSEGDQRFNELQRMVKGISARVLSNELKDLEINGFVTRKIYTKTPVVVEYQLTDYSQTLGEVMVALGNWGAMHREKIMQQSGKPQQS